MCFSMSTSIAEVSLSKAPKPLTSLCAPAVAFTALGKCMCTTNHYVLFMCATDG